jgi:hypothetical protein
MLRVPAHWVAWGGPRRYRLLVGGCRHRVVGVFPAEGIKPYDFGKEVLPCPVPVLHVHPPNLQPPQVSSHLVNLARLPRPEHPTKNILLSPGQLTPTLVFELTQLLSLRIGLAEHEHAWASTSAFTGASAAPGRRRG